MLCETYQYRDITWPLATNAPWFLFTHYPEQNDVFSWLDGTLVIGYILATGLVYGTALLVLLMGATRTLGRFSAVRLHHLAQGLIPLAGAGVFLGLSATTLSLLRAEHVSLWWATDLRIAILAVANLWSAWLAWLVQLFFFAISWLSSLLKRTIRAPISQLQNGLVFGFWVSVLMGKVIVTCRPPISRLRAVIVPSCRRAASLAMAIAA